MKIIASIFLALFCLQEVAMFQNSFAKWPLVASIGLPRAPLPGPPPPKSGPITGQSVLARSSRYKVRPKVLFPASPPPY